MVLKNDIIGYTASTLYVISLFPELYSVYKNKCCNLSIYFLVFQIITTILFITYDILIDVMPLLIADTTLLVELIFLLFFKYTCKKNSNNIKIIVKSSIV